MKFAITYPRSGSHLMARIYGFNTWPARQTVPEVKPKPVELVIKKIKHDSIWIHYPYDKEIVMTVKRMKSVMDAYILLRDPRDIIVSLAHYVKEKPKSFVNMCYTGFPLSILEYEDRVDALICSCYKSMMDHEKYRQSGFFKEIRFQELLKSKMAKGWAMWKRRGIVGSHKDEMTREQRDRCSLIYKDLIKAWA